MRLEVDIKTLNAGILTVIKSLSSKPVIAVLEGIYLNARKDGLFLRCSDMTLQIDCLIAANVDEEGQVVLPGRLFADIVRRLPGEIADMHLEGRTMHIRAGKVRTQLQCMDPKDFPDMELLSESISFSMPQLELKEMIRQTIFAAASDETKPILAGALFELKDNMLTMVALDGFRLALRRFATGASLPDNEAVVPSKALLEIARTLFDSDDSVKVSFSKAHMLVDMGHTRMISRLLEGEFIRYRNILPSEHKTRVRVNREALLSSIERAILLAREGVNNLVRFSIEEDTLKLFANSALGKLDEEMQIHLNGEPIEIAFNARYFSDVMRTLTDEEIFLDINTNISPCVVSPVQGNAFYYLVLPVRIFA